MGAKAFGRGGRGGGGGGEGVKAYGTKAETNQTTPTPGHVCCWCGGHIINFLFFLFRCKPAVSKPCGCGGRSTTRAG